MNNNSNNNNYNNNNFGNNNTDTNTNNSYNNNQQSNNFQNKQNNQNNNKANFVNSSNKTTNNNNNYNNNNNPASNYNHLTNNTNPSMNTNNQSAYNNNNSANNNNSLNNYSNNKNQTFFLSDLIKPEPDNFIGVCIDNLKKLTYVIALIKGKEVTCVLDSGATRSVMSFLCADRIGLKFDKSNMQALDLADGSSGSAYVSHLTSIVVHSRYSTQTFLVTNLKCVDCLLGMDWFKNNECWFNPATKKLIFTDKTYNLNPEITNESNESDDEENLGLDFVFLASEQESNEFRDFEWNFGPSFKIEELIDNDFSDPILRNQAINLINNNTDCFATSYAELGRYNRHKVRLELLSTIPVFHHYYSCNATTFAYMKEEINELLDANLIQPSRSLYGSPAFFVPKKDKGVRMVINYKPLNKLIKKFYFPIRKIDDILMRVSGSTIFSVLDMKSGFYQLPMHEDSIQYTAFSTPIGHYEFLTAPFGICNIPSEFAQIGQQMFGDLDFAEIYFDDVTVFSSSIEAHFSHLQTIFNRLREFNIKLNPDKCKFFKTTVKILGHIVGPTGISMDPAKIRAIIEMPYPKDVKEIRIFNGMVTYYKRYIINLFKLLAPLINLTKLDVIFNFNRECIESFDECKRLLTEEPILRHADMDKPFTIYCDASGLGMGAILAQRDEHGEYVVAYDSKKFDRYSEKLPITLKECSAVIFAVNAFKQYISRIPFTIVTDHQALVHLSTLKDSNLMLLKWSIMIDSLGCKILYRQGKVHTNVDCLSRLIKISNDQPPLALMAQTRSKSKINANTTQTQSITHPIILSVRIHIKIRNYTTI